MRLISAVSGVRLPAPPPPMMRPCSGRQEAIWSPRMASYSFSADTITERTYYLSDTSFFIAGRTFLKFCRNNPI